MFTDDYGNEVVVEEPATRFAAPPEPTPHDRLKKYVAQNQHQQHTGLLLSWDFMRALVEEYESGVVAANMQ